MAHRANRWSGSGLGAATDWCWALSRLGFDLDVPCFLTHSEARVWTLDVWNSRHVVDDGQVERNWIRFARGAGCAHNMLGCLSATKLSCVVCFSFPK